MILSTALDSFAKKLGYAEGVRTLAKAGFDAFDLSMFDTHKEDHIFNQDRYKEPLNEMLEVMKEEGIICNQAHAVFPGRKPDDDEYNEKFFKITVRNMECASILGAKVIVIHPIYYPDCTEEEQLTKNLEMYAEFLPYAKKFNIKIAIENMWTWDQKRKRIKANVCSFGADLARYYDLLDPEWFTVCLDLGHCPLVGDETPDAIRVLGHDRIKALHVHDVDYINDLHTLPYLGKMDWDEIAKALAEIDYDGDFTFEITSFHEQFPKELMLSVAKLSHDTGRFLIEKIEKYKKK